MSTLPPGFSEHIVPAGDCPMHVVEGLRNGPSVVLLHGFPANWYSWRHVMTGLVDDHHVVAVDMRGIGIDAPPQDALGKRDSARQLAALLDAISVERCAVIGHDMGALVAYAFARLFPDRTTHLGFIEQVLPGFGLEQMMDCSKPGQGLWHFPFHLQPDLPEALISGREARYFEKFWAEAVDPTIIAEDEREIYVGAYHKPGALSAGLGWYRSIFTDGDDNRADATPKLDLPATAIGGAAQAGAYPGQSLNNVCADVETLIIPACGHWPQLEQPAATLSAIRKLLSRNA